MTFCAKHIHLLTLLWLLDTAALSAYATTPADSSAVMCPMVGIEARRLPDLNVPRAGHSVFCANGEITVVGGHTNGFIPTATAEYYKDGAWHLIPTAYEHDNALAVVLSSGKVLIAGGHEKHLGIGQTFVAEMYDPQAHRFEGFGSLDSKRSLASATELSEGRVLIAGNHYADDAIECFDGECTFSFVKEVAVGRCYPYILRIANDDAIIFGTYSTHDEPIAEQWADHLKGEPFRVPLLDTWHPVVLEGADPAVISFIGDKQTGDYSHLIAAQRDDGQLAIIRVSGTEFSLLPTDFPIPMQTEWGDIKYTSPLIVNRSVQRGYVVGFGKDMRCYILCVDYGDMDRLGSAAISLYHTAPLPNIGYSMPILTPEGDIVLAGGIIDSNFYPFRSVIVLPVGNKAPATGTTSSFLSSALPWIASFLLFAMLYIIAERYRRRKDTRVTTKATSESPVPQSSDTKLMNHICEAMEGKQMYLNSDLKLTDVAAALNTSPRNIAECIRDFEGISFSQFVNKYRIDHAKRILLEQPDKKIINVAIESGFANETSFFRTFKSITGSTPREWLNQQA